MPDRRPRAIARQSSIPVGKWATGSALALGLALWAVDARSEGHEEVTESHGYSFFGDLVYPADFPHLNYVKPDAPQGGEIAIWSQGTFDSMNPYTRKGRSGALASALYEAILTSAADDINASYCLLCTTMEYPESKDWVIFNLRDDVTFSNGTPMTAEDIAFTYELFINDGIPSFRAAFGSMIEGVEIIDDYTIKFTFTEDAPRRDVIGLAGGFPTFSKAWYEETGYGLDESRLDPGPGTGPYILDEVEVNERIVYRYNPDYWGDGLPINIGRNNFESIRVEYFADGAAALEGFKAGAYTFRSENSSLQWATAYDFPAVQKGWVVVEELPSGNMAPGQSFVFNLRKEKFQDPLVREAISLLFNFEWSNETLFYGLYERINSFWENSDLAATGAPTEGEVALLQPLVDEGLVAASILTDDPVQAPTSNSSGGDNPLDRSNLRRALALMQEAGYEVVDGQLVKDGQPLVVEFLNASPAFERIINPYVENLKRLGVDASLNTIDPAQFTERFRAYDFDMVTHSMPMAFEPGSGLNQYFGSEAMEGSSRNAMGLSDPAVDRLIDVIVSAEDKAEMETGVRALDRVLRSIRFWVPQWYKDVHTVAYYDMFRYPEPLPPFSRGELDFWWYDAEAAEALREAGAFQ